MLWHALKARIHCEAYAPFVYLSLVLLLGCNLPDFRLLFIYLFCTELFGALYSYSDGTLGFAPSFLTSPVTFVVRG